MATATPERIIVGYQDAVHDVRTRVLAYASTVWARAGSWRDTDVDRLVGLIVPRVQAGQVRTAQLTSAYFAALETARTGTPVAAERVDRDLVTGARGVPAEEVYRRPAATIYATLAKGGSLTQAVSSGLARLNAIVASDHQLAKTTQARASASARGFRYMRRTLTGRENCAMCIIASTQRYRVQDLQPMHPGCDCGFDTVTAGTDPGQIIDPELLAQTHQLIEAEFGATDRGARVLDGLNDWSDYVDLIVTREHGELGPVLAWRDQHFTAKADIAALN